MISYHRILTEALQLCLREGHLDQTRANIIQAAFDESVVGAPDIPTAEDRFLKCIGQKFGPNTKNIIQVLNSARKRINDQQKHLQQQQMQQRSQSQRMPASNMSSFSHPPGHQPVHPQGHHSASMQQLPPQSTNMVHVQGGGVNPSMMSRPGMVPMHQASQPMPMMSSSMPSSGYHTMAASANGQPMNSMPGVPPMQSNYMQPQQQAQGMPMQHPSQAMGQPVPQTQAANGKPKGEIKKRAMVQEFLNRAMKLQMISSLEAESYMAEWMKVEHLPIKEQQELIENALGTAYGPRKKSIMEAIVRVKAIIMKEYNDKKSKTTKASLPSQEVVEQNVLYHEQVPNAGPPPHLSLPTNPTPSLTPTPTTAKATKETKKKQQEVTKIIEEKPVEERPDDMLEKVDLNDGELFIEENSRKVYVSPCSNQTEQQEDDSALEIARNSKYLDQQMMHSFPLASSSSSRSIRKNVLNAPLCRKVFTSNAYCKNITLTGEAQQVLSEGIQVHLKNILDSVLKICQEKAQEAKAVYPLDKVVERISEDMMEKVGLKLGPQTETVLNEEETNARKFFESYCREDDRKLQAKMLAEQGEDSLAVGNKRKASDLQDKQTWVQLDKIEADGGNMTWIELAEFQHKLDIMNQMQTDRQSAGTKSQPNNSKAKESRMQLLSTPASITKEDILNIVHNHKFQVIMPTTTSLDHHQK